MKQLRVLDLFSGIGGFSLGLESTGGFKTVAFCEQDPFCQKVLRKHWPEVPIFPDVKKLCRRVYDCEPEGEDGEVFCPRCKIEFGECDCIGTDQFADEIGGIDVIAGGFPCQPHSLAGKRAGATDERNLWPDTIRIVREIQPAHCIFENVPGIVTTILDECLMDLERENYETRAYLVPACAAGAEHKRERLWIVAHDKSQRIQGMRTQGEQIARTLDRAFLSVRDHNGQWQIEPDVCRTTHGLSGRVDRLRALGNAVVPQIVAVFGRAILAAEEGGEL